MRQLGTISTEDHARRIIDFLLTQGIAAVGEPEQGEFAIWVRDEQHLDQARAEFAKFKETPDDSKYLAAQREAHTLRVQQLEKIKEAQKNLHTGTESLRPSIFQRAPLTAALIILCSLIAFSIDFGKKVEPLYAHLTFAEITVDERGDLYVPQNGLQSIREGQVWRLFTPALIHYSLSHLIFNMFWVYLLGSAVEQHYRTWRFAAMLLALAAGSNFCEFAVSGSVRFGGMSGVVYGLFGFVWMKSLFDPRSGFRLGMDMVVIQLAWLGLCFLPQFQEMIGVRVANYAHLSGLILGVAMGLASSRTLRRR